MNEAGTETYFDRPERDRGDDLLARLRCQVGATPPGETAWPTALARLPEGNAAIIQHTTGNLTNVRDKAHFPFGVAGAARQGRRRAPSSAAATSTSSSTPTRPNGRRRCASRAGPDARSGPPTGRSAPATSRPGRTRTRRRRCATTSPNSRPPGSARTPAGRDRRAFHLREPAHLQGADRQHPGGAERQQDAGAAMADTQTEATRILRPGRHAEAPSSYPAKAGYPRLCRARERRGWSAFADHDGWGAAMTCVPSV